MSNQYSTRTSYRFERNRTIKRQWYLYEGCVKEFARQWGLSLDRIGKIITSDRRRIISLLRQKEHIDEQLIALMKREV